MSAPDKFRTKLEWFYDIGHEAGLMGSNLDQYVSFMQIRFPDERFKSYALEWAQRYLTGRPEAYADRQSLKAIEMARKQEVKP